MRTHVVNCQPGCTCRGTGDKLSYNKDVASHYLRALEIIKARDSQVADQDLINKKPKFRNQRAQTRNSKKLLEFKARSMNDILEQFCQRQVAATAKHAEYLTKGPKIESILDPDNPMYDRIMSAARMLNAPKS